MSALGQKQTFAAKRHVRFTPKSGHVQRTRCLLCANSGHVRCDYDVCYGPEADVANIIRGPRRLEQGFVPRTKSFPRFATTNTPALQVSDGRRCER